MVLVAEGELLLEPGVVDAEEGEEGLDEAADVGAVPSGQEDGATPLDQLGKAL